MWTRLLAPTRPHGRRPAPRAAPVLLVAIAVILSSCTSAGESARTSPVPDTAACPRAASTGSAALPPTTLACLTSSGRVQMSRLHGRPEVINIWASWCAPCRQEIPLLQRAHERQGDRVQFVGVDTTDLRGHALSFLAAHGVTYPQVYDPDGSFARALGLRGVPDTLFVDRTGQVTHRVLGPIGEAELEQGLATLHR